MNVGKSGVGTFAAVWAAGVATACGGGLSDTRHPTGSSQIATSSDYDALYVASTDHGKITRFDLETQEKIAVEVGSEPTRIARAGDKVFVTLRGERSVAVLQETKGSLDLVSKIHVGAEPFGVVAPETGDKVYVAVSLENKVVEIDVEDLEISNEWPVENQPRWLAMHPSGVVYVGSAMKGTFTWFEPGRDEVHIAEIPRIDRGAGAFDVRIMGDPAVSSDGYYVAVPTMNIDPRTAIDDTGNIPPVGYYSGRTDTTVVLIPAEGGEPEVGEARLIALSGGQAGDPTGYAASVAFDPEGFKLYASIEGAEAVTVVDIEGEKGASGGLFDSLFGGNPGGVVFFAENRPLGYTKGVPKGPRSVVFTDDTKAFVYGFIDRSVAELDTSDVTTIEAPTNSFGLVSLSAPAVKTRVQLQGPAFSPEIERGRELFYSTNVRSVSNPLSGLSCATCHFDGRNDGVSWTFTRGKRQTPSLAGPVSLTEPVRWEGDRITVEEDAQRTSADAMGGADMSDAQAADIAAFIDSTRDVDVPLATSSDPAIARGLEIFSRPEVGCATCHNGSRMTDNQAYNLFGLLAQTRSLIGAAASPPYLHDGRAETLRDVVLLARDGSMGDTSSLSEAEIDDLVMFLESL